MNNSEAKQTILESDSCFCKHGAYKDCHSGCKYREALDAAVKALEQEPKTGHKVSGDLLGGLYCSECMTYVNEYFNYCPNCGAFCGGDNNG